MGNAVGLVELPVPAGLGGDSSLGDPALVAIGGFCRAVINAYCSTIWGITSPASIEGASGGSPVVGLSFNNPEDSTFNEVDLPALYVFRDHPKGTKYEWVCDDDCFETGTVNVLWVPEPGVQELRSSRAPFFNAIIKTLESCFTMGVDPNWVADGETNTEYLTRGTPIQIAAGAFYPPQFLGAKSVDVTIEMDGLAHVRTYPGLLSRIELVESTAWDLTLFGYPAQVDPCSVIQSPDPSGFQVALDLLPPMVDGDGEVMLDGDGHSLDSE